MNDKHFDELLDSTLHERAHAPTPINLEQKLLQSIQPQQKSTRLHWMALPIAASILLGVFIALHRPAKPAQQVGMIAPTAPPQSSPKITSAKGSKANNIAHSSFVRIGPNSSARKEKPLKQDIFPSPVTGEPRAIVIPVVLTAAAGEAAKELFTHDRPIKLAPIQIPSIEIAPLQKEN